jgi:hypothetical protein
MFYSSSNLAEKSSYILKEITNKATIDDNVDDNVFVAIEPRRDSAALTTEELVSKPIFYILPHPFIFFLSLPEKK